VGVVQAIFLWQEKSYFGQSVVCFAPISRGSQIPGGRPGEGQFVYVRFSCDIQPCYVIRAQSEEVVLISFIN